MRVFITGGTGYVGGVLVERLVGAGHEVVALARSETATGAVLAAGATPLRGELADAALLRAAAADADAVVHAAVDWSASAEAHRTELAAVAALTAGARDGGKTVVYTSTGLVYGFDPAQDRDEDARLPERSAQPVKADAERVVRSAPGITGVVVRAGLVHGRGGSALLSSLIGAAATTGAATYVGAGDNVWVPVHVDDLADLYLRALERPVAGVFNAVGPHPFTFRDLAEAIADLTGASAVSLPLDVAVEQLGPAAYLLASSGDMPNVRARSTFDWEPAGPPLLDDVRAGSYRSPAPTGA